MNILTVNLLFGTGVFWTVAASTVSSTRFVKLRRSPCFALD